MLNLQAFVFNPFQENTYLLYNAKNECWIVDPGMYGPEETNHFIDFLTANKFKPQAIINTHTHIDHILGAQALIDAYKIPFGMHKTDIPVLNSAIASAALFGIELKKAPVPDFYIPDGKPLSLGVDDVEVRFTPGHSPGSIVFYYPEGKWVIGGDVLFAGSIGRTDLPGGDFNTLINSIRTQLFSLPFNTTVYPGHGPSTTIEIEKKHNPFLQ
jgi:glyoxylase-like metal-dependent hydrolase (beta-lactamase superfamily II)